MADNEIDIHCNILNCRKPIYYEQKACVTTCSHIFCIECANVKFGEALICPACQTSLTQKTDIMILHLNPSEEYKSFILAGLKPEHILDICNRGLSFYNYQVSQELCYRQVIQKTLKSKIISLDNQLQDNLREYNRLLKMGNDKLEDLAREFEMEKRRNYDLQENLKQKSIQFTKLQQMYEKLKQKSIGSTIERSIHQNISQQQLNINTTSNITQELKGINRQSYQGSTTSHKSYLPVYQYSKNDNRK
ncbi:unnamed protein product [Cunninghamella echinulata]